MKLANQSAAIIVTVAKQGAVDVHNLVADLSIAIVTARYLSTVLANTNSPLYNYTCNYQAARIVVFYYSIRYIVWCIINN